MNIKEEIKKIKKIKGKTRGQEIKSAFDCIESIGGKEGKKKVEEKLEEFDILPDYKNYEDFKWYPVKFDVAPLVVAKEILGWDKKKIREQGSCVIKASFIQKIFVKYFTSLEKMLETGPQQWKRYYNFGGVTIKEYDKENKTIKLHIRDFDLHPAYCEFLVGYFEKALELLVSSKKITGKETKCTFRGDKIHELVFKYE